MARRGHHRSSLHWTTCSLVLAILVLTTLVTVHRAAKETDGKMDGVKCGVFVLNIALPIDSDLEQLKKASIKSQKKVTTDFEKKDDLSKQLKLAKSAVVGAGGEEAVGLEVPSTLHDTDDPQDKSDPVHVSYVDPKDTQEDHEDALNRTLEMEKANHKYFQSTMYSGGEVVDNFWINTTNDARYKSFRHDILSNSHRRAAVVSLPFKFPFYGNYLSRITIATGGFLYMGDHVHAWLAATQYVAPLMGNFDTRNQSSSNVAYAYNDTVFAITWEKVMLQEHPDLFFTFQCQLYSNGDIAFVYKDIPIAVEKISDQVHPVKVGVSDAYFINRSHAFLRKKTIYEYHKVDMRNFTITNNTAIFLRAMPTCLSLKGCRQCVTANINFDCVYCAALDRCSDGYDRQRQEWISKHCDSVNIQTGEQCLAVNGKPPKVVVSP